jgi:hypothetical protein
MNNSETEITIKEDFYVELPVDDERHLVLFPGFDLNYFEVGKAYQITPDPTDNAFAKKFDGILKSATPNRLLFTYYEAGSLFEYKVDIKEYVERDKVYEIIKYNKE